MMTKTKNVLAAQILNANGEYESVASIVAAMQQAGTDQRLIDRWLQGLGRNL